MWSLSMGISIRPAALPLMLPSTMLHSAAVSSSPRSMPSFKMMGLNKQHRRGGKAHRARTQPVLICAQHLSRQRSRVFLPLGCCFFCYAG